MPKNRAAPPAAPADEPSRADAPASPRTRRYLLPTLRVAEFQVPNVGEFIKLREAVVLKARKLSGDNSQNWDVAEATLAFADVGLPRLLTGLSRRPVSVIYTREWDPERARGQSLETARLWLARNRARAKIEASGGTAEQADVAAKDAEAEDVPLHDPELAAVAERAFVELSYNFEDSEAMKAAANIAPVRDADWELDDGAIVTLMRAELGSEQATEWIALGQIVQDFFVQLVNAARGATGFAGKERPATRSWR